MADQAQSAAPEQQRTLLLAAHAQLSGAIAERYIGRVPPHRVLQLYCGALDVVAADMQWLKSQLGRAGLHERYERQPAVARRGVLRFRDWLRINAAPHGDPALRARIDSDLAQCRRLIGELQARLATRNGQAVPAAVRTSAAPRPGFRVPAGANQAAAVSGTARPSTAAHAGLFPAMGPRR
jgi:hypothetical protein